MQTWVDLKFADGEYRFALGLPQISEIEKKCDAGIGEIYARVLSGRYGLGVEEILPIEARYKMSELVEVIRQMLIGGGEGVVDGQAVRVGSVRANELLNNYVLGMTDMRMAVREVWALAAAGLSALIEGYTPPKKAGPAVEPAKSRTASTTRRRSPTEQ